MRIIHHSIFWKVQPQVPLLKAAAVNDLLMGSQAVSVQRRKGIFLMSKLRKILEDCAGIPYWWRTINLRIQFKDSFVNNLQLLDAYSTFSVYRLWLGSTKHFLDYWIQHLKFGWTFWLMFIVCDWWLWMGSPIHLFRLANLMEWMFCTLYTNPS